MEIQASQQSSMQSVLAQMRSLRDQVPQEYKHVTHATTQAKIAADTIVGEAVQTHNLPPNNGFRDLLADALQSVNSLQKAAGASANDFVNGKETDLVKVMIDSQKASVGFQALVQVRNRAVTAYQDIMNMPI